jgi:phosphate starvation-inducible PhoH-like protein
LLQRLYQESEISSQISADLLHLMIQSSQTERNFELVGEEMDEYDAPIDVYFQTRKGRINPRGANQKRYVQRILQSDISFGVGPAGTGKTYLAVAAAVDMLERNEIQRILLVRPAVEAGEKLGFLPGDLTQKIDPYLRPLYDALYEMLGFEKVAKLIERQVIEVAPLAYMRGRTLNHSFVILDEAQNTTPEQMKMFLTRLGFGSRAVITGDVTQVDLPRGQQSGLAHALRVLENVHEIHITPEMLYVINWFKKLLKLMKAGIASSNVCLLKLELNAKQNKKHWLQKMILLLMPNTLRKPPQSPFYGDALVAF